VATWFFDFLLRLSGATRAELDGQPWAVQLRRLVFGYLVLAAGVFGGVLLTLAVARIDPTNPARWVYAPIAGLIYMAVLAGYDSLFVATCDATRGRALWPRVALSVIMTAFTATTIDALMFGDRLLAEIDYRRTQATLEARDLHSQVHALGAKSEALEEVSATVDALNRDLAGDPQTAEFEEVTSAVANATEEWQTTRAAAEPRIELLRGAAADLRQQLAASTDLDEASRQALGLKLADTNRQIRDLQRQVQERKRALDAATHRADQLRREWRAEKAMQRTQALGDQRDAAAALRTARSAAEHDSEKTAEVNAKAFKPGLIEELVAFWSLALREQKYLAIGLVLWLTAAAFELLAILGKLYLKPDAFDARRRTQAAMAIVEAETELQVAQEEGVAQRMREARAKAESDEFFGTLKFKRRASEEVSDALVTAFVRLQQQRELARDPAVQASLEVQFAAYQRALDEQVSALFGGPVATAPSTASPTGAAAPSAAGGRPAEAAKTIVL
jgi:hypothetical protein